MNEVDLFWEYIDYLKSYIKAIEGYSYHCRDIDYNDVITHIIEESKELLKELGGGKSNDKIKI